MPHRFAGRLLILVLLAVLTLLPAATRAQVRSAALGTARAGSTTPGTQGNTKLKLFGAHTVHGDYQAAGCGMRNLGYCSITIANIPAVSTVSNAYLVWTMLLNDSWQNHNTGTFNGQGITGAHAGTGQDPCWGNSSSVTLVATVT